MLASQLMTILYMYMMCMYPHNCLLPYTSFPGLVWNGYGISCGIGMGIAPIGYDVL